MSTDAHGYNPTRTKPLNRAGSSNAQSGQGPASRYWNVTRSAPSNRNTLALDEARLRPHLRTVQPMTFTPAHTDETSALGNYTSSIDTARAKHSLMVDPLELRGLPVVGRGVGGCSPGTQPEAATISKLSKERAA